MALYELKTVFKQECYMKWVIDIAISMLSSDEIQALLLKLLKMWTESTENTWDDKIYEYVKRLLNESKETGSKKVKK